MSRDSSNSFSCDLVEEAKKHIAFLQTLHANSISINKPSRDTFRRYSELWLPLVHRHSLDNSNAADAKSSCVGLIAPADIAWLWHCHRLAPYRYARHIQNLFFSSNGASSCSSIDEKVGTRTRNEELVMLDPEHPFVVLLKENTSSQNLTFQPQTHTAAAEYTEKLWTEMYPSEPFVLSSYNKEECKDTSDSTSMLLSGFDVIESCQRQTTFLWQVSQEKFQQDSFLKEGVENYFKFIMLMKRNKDRPRFLVPTYQIDLMWHTHILSSIKAYHRDCQNVIGT